MEIETLTPTKTSSGDLFEHFKDDPKKIDVISKLPEDFPKQVIKYVREVEKECEETGEKFDLESSIGGRVFEVLVREQFSNMERDSLEDKISKEIQDLISNPSRYGTFMKQIIEFKEDGEEDEVKKIPDVAHINVTKKGYIEIDSVVEAKKGLLGKHASTQLKRDAFLRTLRRITRNLIKLSGKSLKEQGLKALGETRSAGDIFTVSSNLDLKLVVPSGRSLNFEGFEGKLINTEELWGHKKDVFEKELREIDIQNS